MPPRAGVIGTTICDGDLSTRLTKDVTQYIRT
jgi:hypothetical protein